MRNLRVTVTIECAIPMDSIDYIPMYKRPPITAQVVIGTPGTILYWTSAKKLGVNYVKILVFDEADQMLAEPCRMWSVVFFLYANSAFLYVKIVGWILCFFNVSKNMRSFGEREDRDEIVKEFNDGLTRVLVSTDLLDQGFDQQQIKLVINYDLPVKHDRTTQPDFEAYMHRIRIAGRFGRKGAVFHLLCGYMDGLIMSEIENHSGIEVAELVSVVNW
ncbi:hypothetical protein V6N11_028339 [Hibiscus sabdariffa]|uniref:Helicase C-terminal domain-containing protein n=1 Tax=Hibiscus sabdariffa TaxID=183260 RepID=A0ABR2NQ89_9ROSI